MKLLLATPLYPPEAGGPATYARILKEGLSAKGIEVNVTKFSDVRHLPKLVRHFAYYRQLLKAAKDADIILALDPVSVGLPAMLVARKFKKPFVVKIVGDYAWEQGRQRFGITENLDAFVKTSSVPLAVRFLRSVQRAVALSAKRIIVPSEYLQRIIATWGVPQESITVIYNAIEAESGGTVPLEVAELPKPLVVTAGRLVPWKHIDAVIDAVGNLPNVSLAIIGDGPLRIQFIEQAERKLPGRCIFTGNVTHKDALAIIERADIFVLNSSYEGLSHFLIEALSVGAAIVATRAGGNPEVIQDRQNGLLIDMGDTTCLQETLQSLLANQNQIQELKHAARISSVKFSTESMLDSMSKFFKTL